MSNQLSQLPVEILTQVTTSTIPLRVSQLPVEALVRSSTPIALRVSQLPVEVLVGPALATAAQLSQLPVEVLLAVPLTPSTLAQLSQLPLEVLREATVTYAAEIRVTQIATELGSRQPGALTVTQLALEVPSRQVGALAVTQVLLEVVRPVPAPVSGYLGTPGIAWMEWRGRTGPARTWQTVAYSDWDLQDPPAYYFGFKAARVESFGTATRTLSDPRTGDWQGSTCEMHLTDPARELREALASTPERFGADAFVTVRMVSRPVRAQLGEPLTVFAGPIRRAAPAPPLNFTLLLEDAIGHGMLTDQLLIPQRVVDSSRLPGITLVETVTGHPVPVLYGVHAREHGAVAPIYLGIESSSGQHVWLVAGHYAGVTDLFVDGISVLGLVGSDWWVTAEDIDGHRYTLIRGRAGAPPSLTDPVLYAENAGAGPSTFETWVASWPLGGGGAIPRWDVNSPTTPHSGLKCMAGIDLREGELVKGSFGLTGPPGTAVPRGYVIDDYADLLVWVKNGTSFWPPGHALEFAFYVNPTGTPVGTAVLVFHGEYGFDETNPAWQLVTIPIADFAVTPGDRSDYIVIRKTGADPIAVSLDDISLSGGTEAEGELTQPDMAAIGSATLTINVTGWTTTGDNAGAVLTDLYAQYQHFLINYVATPAGYLTGPPLANPEIDLYDRLVHVIDEASFATAAAQAVARYPPEGYIGRGVLGATLGDRLRVRDWIARWNLSADCRLGVSRYGEIFIVLTDPTTADADTAPIVDDVQDILESTFRVDTQWEAQATRVPYRADYDWAAGAWQAVGRDADDNALAELYGRPEGIQSPVKDYWFVPSSDQGKNVAEHEVARVGHPPRVVEFETDLDLATVGLGGYLRVRHFAGVGPSGLRLVQIEELTVAPGERRVRLRAVDVTGLVLPAATGGL